MDIGKEKIMARVKNIIEEDYFTINYTEGYIDALFDWNLINDDEFAKLNKLLEVRIRNE